MRRVGHVHGGLKCTLFRRSNKIIVHETRRSRDGHKENIDGDN